MARHPGLVAAGVAAPALIAALAARRSNKYQD